MTALLLGGWLFTDLVATYGVWFFWRSIVPLQPAAQSPPVAVIVAIKGTTATTAEFLQRLCSQDYRAYRVIFAVESTADPALALIERARGARAAQPAIEVVVAGLATRRAQKVHNLLAALGALDAGDRIVAFADADVLMPPSWLTDLVRPIARGESEASTGYRWPLPLDRRLATLVGAAVDLSITTSARSRRWNVCWGGSCAVSRDTLERLQLQQVWDRAASDDVTLTRALRRGGHVINAPLRVLVPSPVAHSWVGLFGFARRQYLMVRTYAPRHWLLGGWCAVAPALGACAALAGIVQGDRAAPVVMLASVVLLQVRIMIRIRIARRILPAEAQAAARSTLRFARIAWPLAHAVNLLAYLSSGLGNGFTWAGVRYRLAGRDTSVGERR
jgi:hypothetical protein